ncbi:MAG: hypothetical protein NWF00_00965 [Candidatus Bathyarchaeota archaeon]|nr:hypothetical protein [Candidatus Bathyarchaeota archaeon]
MNTRNPSLHKRAVTKRVVFASLTLMLLVFVLFGALPAKAEYKPQSSGTLNLSSGSEGGLEKDDVIYSIANFENSTVLAGYTKSSGAGGSDMWLVKTVLRLNVFPGMGDHYMDSVEWRKTYGGTQNDAAKGVVVASDGSFVLAGYTESCGAGGSDAYLVKTDCNGSLLWQATFGGAEDDGTNAIVLADDGGYLLAGYTNSDVPSQSAWVVKTDSDGNLQWNATYSGQSVKSVTPADDGGYVLATEQPNAFGLVKIDSTGQVKWNKTYAGSRTEAHVESMIQTVDGGYALAGCIVTSGFNSSSPWLVKTDPSGNLQWERDYGGILGVYSLAQTSEGGYAMCGDRACLIVTDSDGDVLWSRNYDSLSEDNLQFTRAYCIIEPNPNQFLMGSTQQSYGQFLTGLDAQLIRVTLRDVEDTTSPPVIAVLSPENKIYTNSSIPLVFTINKPAIWMGYQIDNGRNVTITGNTTITDLPDGRHNMTLYAADVDYNNGRSETVHFENFVVDTVPVVVTLSLQDKSTFESDGIPLNFTANKPVALVTYSIDGQTNQTFNPTTTLAGLASGTHTLTLYAQDELGLVGASNTIQFNVKPAAEPSQSPSPTHTSTSNPTLEPAPSASPTPASIHATAEPTGEAQPQPTLQSGSIYIIVGAAAIAAVLAFMVLGSKRNSKRHHSRLIQ